MSLVIVTATTNLERARPAIESWGDVPMVIVANGTGRVPAAPSPNAVVVVAENYLASVPAFRLGVDYALEHLQTADIVACLHDDLILQDAGWVKTVVRHFERTPACGLAGFGGAIGLGAENIYQTPYQPMQLARIGFRSNLVDAEVHGMRSLLPERVACLDGFSQIGRREFFAGLANQPVQDRPQRPWTHLQRLGVRHHAYDSMLGCLAARAGWDTWYLPVRCHHLGGQTAVGDAGYQAWAKTQLPDGDHGFWEQAHKIFYRECKDVLPLRVPQD